MAELTLSEINIYPIKSLGGISLDSSYAGERGLQYDRRYLLVDEKGIFQTQRDFPQLALFKLSFTEDGFKVLNIVDNKFITIPFKSVSTDQIEVQIWDDICSAVKVDKNFDEWFSNALKINYTSKPKAVVN